MNSDSLYTMLSTYDIQALLTTIALLIAVPASGPGWIEASK